MKKFKNFEIANQELIFGGELMRCMHTNSDGSVGGDVYATSDRIVYF